MTEMNGGPKGMQCQIPGEGDREDGTDFKRKNDMTQREKGLNRSGEREIDWGN